MSFSWQDVRGIEGCEPDSTKRWGSDGGSTGVWTVLGGEGGTIGIYLYPVLIVALGFANNPLSVPFVGAGALLVLEKHSFAKD